MEARPITAMITSMLCLACSQRCELFLGEVIVVSRSSDSDLLKGGVSAPLMS